MNKWLIGIAAFLCCGCAMGEAAPPATLKVTDKTFYDTPKVQSKSRAVDYDLSLGIENFKLALPEDFKKEETYGLVVFISPDDNGSPPQAWLPILAERKLLLLGPDKAGNNQEQPRRMGLGILGTLAMQKEYKIDAKRIYVAGVSGGARTAADMAFHRPDLYSGTIQSVGSNFVREVPRVKALRDKREGINSEAYRADEIDVAKVKKNVSFVIVTGVVDFRYGHLHDIYEGGFRKDGFKAKLIDVPGMGHTVCEPAQLVEALDFIEGK